MPPSSIFRTTAGLEWVKVTSPLTRRACLDAFKQQTSRKRPQYRTDPIVGWAIGNFIFATRRAASGGPLGRHLSMWLREQDGGTRAVGYIHWYPAVLVVLALLVLFVGARFPLVLLGIAVVAFVTIRPKAADPNDDLVSFVSDILTGRARVAAKTSEIG